MFRGNSTLNLDSKGRLAIPSRYRARLMGMCEGQVVVTLNPRDRNLWIYPLTEWVEIEKKLLALPDFDKEARRTKQIMLGYAEEFTLDSHGRIRIPASHQEIAEIDKQVVLLGQGNKFEIWNEKAWSAQREEWLAHIDEDVEPSESLKQLSL